MTDGSRRLAIVTGASSGIGYELARYCANHGFDLIIAADEPDIEAAAEDFRRLGADVQAVQVDLSTEEGVERLFAMAGDRPVEALLANAGHGLGGPFLVQSFTEVQRVIDTNVTGTLRLIQKVLRRMRMAEHGRILITGSIAGFMPGTYNAVYNGTKAFIDNFSYALREELKDSGITVTCLMPGPTDTDFFERAGMEDTKVATGAKDDPARVARLGFDAMMEGEADVVTGWKNKIQTAMAAVTPSEQLARQHAGMAKPGGGTE